MAELVGGLKEQNTTLADLCKESYKTEADIRANIAQFLHWAAFADKYVTEPHAQKYYTYFKDFFDRVTVRASHIVLRLPPGATTVDKDAAIKKLRSIREQILAGKLDFAA